MEVPLKLRQILKVIVEKELRLLEGMKQLRHRRLQVLNQERSQPHEKFLIVFTIFSMSRYG